MKEAMRQAAMLLALLSINILALTSQAIGNDESHYPGIGALRNGGKLLFFKHGFPGDPQVIIPVLQQGKKTLIVASSDGTITYLDSSSAYRTLSICSGRTVKMAHARTAQGGAVYAICYSREKGVASFATIMDSGGFKFFGLADVSRRDSSGTGFIYSDYRIDFPSVVEPPTPLVADIDGDGYEEALIYLDKQLLYVKSPYGEPKIEPIYQTPLGFSFGDVDGDGRKEVVISSSEGVLLWRPGEILRTYSSQACFSKPILADFDGDGATEVICRRGDIVQVMKGNSVILRAEGGVTEPTVHDINGDGKPELIHVMVDGTLIARSLSGVLWRAKLEAPLNRPVVADVDGDFKPEIVVASGQYVYCFSNEGREKWRLSLREPVGWVSGGNLTLQTYVRYEAKTQAFPIDFDGDGLLELLVGIGAYLEQGRIALIDEVSGAGKPPLVEVLQPVNHSRVGSAFNLSFRVSDDLSSMLKVKLSIDSKGWVEIWSGEVKSGELVKKELPSSEKVLIEASDGIQTSRVTLMLRVDTEPPAMVIEPRNMSKIGPGTNITVRILAPIDEYAFLTVYHGTGSGQWSRILERRVWKTSLVSIDVTPIVADLSGYHCFKFHLVDKYGNIKEVVMRYKIERKAQANAPETPQLELIVPESSVSGEASISFALRNVGEAKLYYGKGQEWNLISEINGSGSFKWDVSNLSDGIYLIKLESGNLSVVKQVRIDNTPPKVELKVDKERLTQGDVAVLRVEGDFLKLYWDLDGDGIFETLGPPEARIQGIEPGKLRINVMGVDEANNSAIASVEIEVIEAPQKVQEVIIENRSEEKSTDSISLRALMRPELLIAVPLLLVILMLKGSRKRERRSRNPWK